MDCFETGMYRNSVPAGNFDFFSVRTWNDLIPADPKLSLVCNY